MTRGAPGMIRTCDARFRNPPVDIDRKLALKLDGSQMAANTANRIRIVARACVQSAIAAGAVPSDVWGS